MLITAITGYICASLPSARAKVCEAHLFLIAACVFLLSAAGLAQAEIRVGFAERDISPEIGMEQPADYFKIRHTAFHDACKARAVVFDDGNQQVALVGVDLGSITRELVMECRVEIENACGLPASGILIGASHTHSGGQIDMIQPGDFDHAPPLIRKLAYTYSPVSDPKYVAIVRKGIVDAVVEAHAKRQALTVGFGKGHEDKVSFNRRIRMKNGLTYTFPSQGNPDISPEGYAGPIDPEVGVVGVWDAHDHLTGCIVNFACHATCAPGGISADYIYYIERTIRSVFGEHVVMIFLSGAAGDITPLDNLSDEVFRGGDESAQFVGGRVGAEAIKVLYSIRPRVTDVKLDALTQMLTIPRRKPSEKRLAAAYELVKSHDPAVQGFTNDWIWAKETVVLDAIIKKQPTASVEVQAIQVGPAVVVANPAEYFVQYALDIKKNSDFPFTWVVTLANGYCGYVPTEEAFGPRGGGYETRLTSYSNLHVAAGTRIAEASKSLIEQLTPQPLPRPDKPRKFQGAWPYGNVPPQRE